MSSIYEKNYEALAKDYKLLLDYLDRAKKMKGSFRVTPTEQELAIRFEEKGFDEDIEIIEETARDGSSILKVKKDNRVYYLDSKRNPGFIADTWMEGFDNLPRTAPIIMFGVGDGSFLKKLDEKLTEDAEIVIFEPSTVIFDHFLRTCDISDIIKRRKISLFVDNLFSFEGINSILASKLKIENTEFLQKYVLPGYASMYPEEVNKIMKIVRDVVDSMLVYYSTISFFSNIAIANVLYNSMYLPDASISVQFLDAIPRDMPAIVVAAGPSLNKNINELKRAKNKAFIIACDTAIKPLMKARVVPDMFAVVDGVKPLDLVDVPGVENIPLLTSVISSQAVLEFHKGKKIFYNEDLYYVDKPFAELGIDFPKVASGGSVATTAFSFAYMIGIDTIIMVGQDLAYTNNKTHADGTFKEEMEETDTTKCVMVPGNYVDKIPTGEDLKIFLDWFNYYIKGCKGHRENFRVINATEGGARIDNTEVMTLKEAIDQCCDKEFDYKAAIEAVEPVFTGKNREHVVSYLKSTEQGFKNIATNAKKQKKLYKKIENMTKTGNISENEYLKLLTKIKKLNKDVLRSPLYQLIDDTLIDASIILRKELLVEEDSLLDEAKELARKGLLYMDLVDQCATLFEGVSANSISTVE